MDRRRGPQNSHKRPAPVRGCAHMCHGNVYRQVLNKAVQGVVAGRFIDGELIGAAGETVTACVQSIHERIQGTPR